MGEVAEHRWRSEGEDKRRAVASQEIIHSDNEIYLMSLNKQLCKEKRENKQNARNNQSYLYNHFHYTLATQIPHAA
jgi:hypothetical protein